MPLWLQIVLFVAVYLFPARGDARRKLGYPVEHTIKSSENGGTTVVLEMEVTAALSTAKFDVGLFEPPAGYTEAALRRSQQFAGPKFVSVTVAGNSDA